MQQYLQTKRFAVGAVLMALSTALLSGGAQAAEHISLRGVDLSTSVGSAVFKARVDVAARHVCQAQGRLDLEAAGACREAVRTEAYDQLSAAQRDAVAAAQTSTPMRVATLTAH